MRRSRSREPLCCADREAVRATVGAMSIPAVFPAPAAPAFPPEHSATVPELLRYEDVAQDGRLMPIAMPTQLGGLWQHVLDQHPGSKGALAQGIIPVLSRLTMHTGNAPIRVDRPVTSTSGFCLARDDEPGDPKRLFMLAWTETSGMGGRMGPMQPDGAPTVTGQLFAEHTFTRPFATPDFRRVTRLNVEGFPEIPEFRYAAPDATTASEVPEGGRWRDELTEDPTPIIFSLDQTDSNQHVNSLVYVRMFIDAALRRVASVGEKTKLRTQAIDVAYRKPCFAGEQVRAHVRLYDSAAGLGVAGFLAAPGDAKPRVFVRLQLTV